MGQDLSNFLDSLERLQRKRVKIESKTAQDRKAIYAVKAALGDGLRTFEYHARDDMSDAYAIMSFNDREIFDEIVNRVTKDLGVRLAVL